MNRLGRTFLLWWVALTAGLFTAPASGQSPYSYLDMRFNKGMNPSAGPFFTGDDPLDVVNALWDVNGFMYPRNAFYAFNNTRRGAMAVQGMSRFITVAKPPDVSAVARFTMADSGWVYTDSSVTDPAKGFKVEGAGFRGMVLDNTPGGLDSIFSFFDAVGTTNAYTADPWARIVPTESFFKTIDSAQYLRGDTVFTKVICWLNTNQILVQASHATDTINSYRIRARLDPGAQAQFLQFNDKLLFADSTKPIRFYDGTDTTVTVGFLADSIYDATVTTSINDGKKAYFTDQWAGYWLRMHASFQTTTRNGVTRAHSPFVPITSNTDTVLYLRFDPTLDGQAFIMSYPIEMQSKEDTLVGVSNPDWIRVAGLPSSWTTLWGNTNTLEYRNAAYPLEILFTSGAAAGKSFVVSHEFGDTLYFTEEPLSPFPAAGDRCRLLVHRPIIPLCMTVHQDRLWVVDVAYPNRIYYSEPLQPEAIGPLNYIDIFPRDGDRTVALASYKDQLLAMKTKSIARVVGDNPNNFVVLPYLNGIGTAGFQTVSSFGGDLYFFDPQTGIYDLREFNPVRISDPVKVFLDSIPPAAAKKASLTIFRDNLWFAYASGSGQATNNRLLSFNFRLGANWSRHTFTKAANFSVWGISGDSVRLMLADPDSGKVYYYNDTAHVDAGQSALLKMTYKTGWSALSGSEKRKRLRQLELAFEADSITGVAGDIDTCYLYSDFATAAFDTLTYQRAGQTTNYLQKPINGLGYGRFFQLEFRIAPRTAFRFNAGRKKYTDIGF